MKKTTALLAAAALLAACGPQEEINADDVRAAMPKPDQIQMATPDDAAAPVAKLGSPRQALETPPDFQSEYARTSYFLAATVNVGVWWSLTLVNVITAFPPSSCADDTCIWGPWPGEHENVWKLVVNRAGSGYAYALSVQPAAQPAAEFVTILSGTAYSAGDRIHGYGDFRIDFDAAASVDPDPQTDFGAIEVAYDSRSALAIDCVFLGAKSSDPADPVFMNAAYEFDATGNRGGQLQIAFRTLETVPRNLSLHTRWNDEGAGRGDARFFATDGSYTVTYQASECWNGSPSFALSYDTDPAFGSVDACVYASAAYADVVVP